MIREFEAGEEKRETGELSEKEKLARLWTLIFLRGAKESYPRIEPEDGTEKILNKVQANPDFFKKFIRSKNRFEFAVHQAARSKRVDFDVQLAIWFFKKAGIDISSVEGVEMGQEPVKNKINIELGGAFGVHIPRDWSGQDQTVRIDHHLLDRSDPIMSHPTEGQELLLKTSSGQMIFEGLCSLGLFDHLEKNERETLQKISEFLTQMDNKNYPGQHELDNFKRSDKNLIGLYRLVRPDKLFEFFKSGGRPDEQLSDSQLRSLGLLYKMVGGKRAGEIINHAEERNKSIKHGLEMVKEKAENGFVVEVRWGKDTLKFLVDYIPNDASEKDKKGIPLRTEAVLASGYEGVVLYNEKTQSYFINLNPESPQFLELNLPQGVNVRGKMTIKNVADKGPLQTSLQDLIRELGGDPYQAKKGLQQAIEKNEKWMREERITLEVGKKSTEQEKWFSLDKIRWFSNEKNPGKSHWGISSDLVEARTKHVVITGLPRDFDPRKLSPGSKILLRFIRDTQPDNPHKGVVIVEMVRTAEEANNKSRAEKRSQTESGTENKKFEKVKVLMDVETMEWMFILPTKEKISLSEELKQQGIEIDARYFYDVETRTINGKLVIVKLERTDQKASEEEPIGSQKEDDKGDSLPPLSPTIRTQHPGKRRKREGGK